MKSLSKGLQATNASRPRVLRQRALNTFGREPRTSRVAGMSLTSSAVREEPRRSVLCPGNGRIGSLIYFARRCASGEAQLDLQGII